MIVEDNGPGIVKAQVPNVFGRLLYGSKFHRLRQSRGQQGIGISAAGMYGLLTTGRPVIVRSKAGKRAIPLEFEIRIDTAKNRPEAKDRVIEWDKDHGTSVQIDMEEPRASSRMKMIDEVDFCDPNGGEAGLGLAIADRIADSHGGELVTCLPEYSGLALRFPGARPA